MKNQSINLFSRTGITILASIVAPITVLMVMALYFPKTWDAAILKLGLARGDTTTQRTKTVSANPSQNKTPELMEVLDTPAGALPVIKYANDGCLYAKATTAHIDYYGMDQLKSQLKKRYQVQCVLWN
jgi:hypothetical protein